MFPAIEARFLIVKTQVNSESSVFWTTKSSTEPSKHSKPKVLDNFPVETL